jgi:hypothetical protein
MEHLDEVLFNERVPKMKSRFPKLTFLLVNLSLG